MRTIKMTLMALVAAALLTGCVDLTVGRPIASDQIKLVREGLTTQGEVQGYFGQPNHKTRTPTGEIWVYRYVSPELTTVQELVVSFGEDQTVCVISRDGI